MRPIKKLIRRLLANQGYGIYRRAAVLATQPEGELRLDLDLVLAHYLQHRAPDVFFIQIGANDGVESDPLYKYIMKGAWSGILVEPQRPFFEKLRERYKDHPGLRVENVAIADTDGVREFYTIDVGRRAGLPPWAGGLASFRRDVILSHKTEIPDIENLMRSEMVRCCTFDTLIQNSGATKVDLIQIDAEGYDYEILKMIDLRKYSPAIVRYEHVHLSRADQESCAERLVANDYLLCMDHQDTMAYAKRFAMNSL